RHQVYHPLPGPPIPQRLPPHRFPLDTTTAIHLPASYPPRLGALLAARVDLFHAHVRHRSGNSPHTRLLSVAPRFSLLLSFLLFLVQRGMNALEGRQGGGRSFPRNRESGGRGGDPPGLINWGRTSWGRFERRTLSHS